MWVHRWYTRIVPIGIDMYPRFRYLTTRRDDIEFGRSDVDFATMRALLLTTFHVQAGHEGRFVDAVVSDSSVHRCDAVARRARVSVSSMCRTGAASKPFISGIKKSITVI